MSITNIKMIKNIKHFSGFYGYRDSIIHVAMYKGSCCRAGKTRLCLLYISTNNTIEKVVQNQVLDLAICKTR